MSITERLANLPIPVVIVTVVILLALRYLLLKQKHPVAKSIAELAESLAVAMGLVFLIIRPFIIQAFFIPSESMVPTLLTHDHIMVNKFVYRFKEPKPGDITVFKAPPEATGEDAEKDFIKRVIAVPGDKVRITSGYVRVGPRRFDHAEIRGLLCDAYDGTVKLTNDKVLVNDEAVPNKRIATALGCPDAQVEVVPGTVYINGKPIAESYTAEDPDEEYPRNDTPRQWVVKDGDDNEVVRIPNGRLLVMGDNRNDSNDSRFWGLLERKRVMGKAMFIFWPLNRIGWIR
jgi:signal peptidase I